MLSSRRALTYILCISNSTTDGFATTHIFASHVIAERICSTEKTILQGLQKRKKKKRWSISLIERVILSTGAMLIFSISFQFDHVLLLGSEKKFAIMVHVSAFAL